MKIAKAAAFLAVTTLLLTGCDQNNAPSDKVEKAAQDIVAAVKTDSPDESQFAGPYQPRDDCSTLKNAQPFINALRAAVKMRDAEVLGSLVAKDVQLDFGGTKGRANFIKELNNPQLHLWSQFDQILQLGCAANDRAGITMPWYFAQHFDNPQQDMIVTGVNVPVHATPDPASARIATVSWDVVEAIQGPLPTPSPMPAPTATSASKPTHRKHEHHHKAKPTPTPTPSPSASATPALPANVPLVHVRLPSNADTEERDGYIRADMLRSVLDYRIIAATRNGRWRIVQFVKGD